MKASSLSILSSLTILISVGLMVLLYSVSTDISRKQGSFLRTYPPHPVMETATMPIQYDAYYFAGSSGDMLYLAHRKTPRHVLGIRKDFRDTVHIVLDIPGLERHKNFRVDVQIDSPYFYFMDGTVPYVYRGTVFDWKADPILYDTIYFLNATPISPASLAIHSFSNRTREDELGKKFYSISGATLHNDLLQKQLDGSFCVSGSLKYNAHLNRLVYVYLYRNEYFVMDTSLNLDYRAHTIDTFSRAQVRFDTLRNTREVRLSGPSHVVNKRFALFKQWLLVHSMVPSRNELIDTFTQSSVIDVYDLHTQHYRFSFYINDFQGEKLKDLMIRDAYLYALFDHGLKRYAFVTRYFSPEFNDTMPVSQE